MSFTTVKVNEMSDLDDWLPFRTRLEYKSINFTFSYTTRLKQVITLKELTIKILPTPVLGAVQKPKLESR